MQNYHHNRMAYLHFIWMIVAIIGCGGTLPGQGVAVESFPIVNPDDPATIARWEASEYNFAEAKIFVVKLAFFHGAIGTATPKESKSVALEVAGAMNKGITSEQEAAISHFIQNEPANHVAVRDAIYKYYRNSYSAYKEGWSLGAAMLGGGEDISTVLPEISSGNELDKLVQITTIYVHPTEEGVASIGIDFAVPWDEENGMGLRMREGKVEAIGSSHEALPVP